MTGICRSMVQELGSVQVKVTEYLNHIFVMVVRYGFNLILTNGILAFSMN